MVMGVVRRAAAWFAVVVLLAACPMVLRDSASAAALKEDKSAPKPYSKEEDGYSEVNGVAVTTKLDKDSYKSGETAQVTLEVKNTNAYEVTDLKVNYKLPNNFKVTEGKKSEQIDSLAAGETKSFMVRAEVTEDKNAPLVKGAYTVTVCIAVVAVVAVLCIIFFLFSKKKKGKKALSMFLAFVLAGSCICVGNSASVSAENEKTDSAGEKDAGTSEPTKETGNYKVDTESFLYRISVHDPSVVKDPESGMYYIFGTHLSFAKSKDLMQWESVYTNLQEDYEELLKEPWEEWSAPATTSTDQMRGMLWAPDIIWNDTMKKWCMYMSVNGDNWVSSICLLTADKIEGPYKYEGVVVYSGVNNPNKKVDADKTDIYKVLGKDADLDRYKSTAYSCVNAIDPNVRYDDKGDLYMTYGSWSAGIFQLKLDTKTGLRDYKQTYETKRDESDAYLGKKIAGGYYCSGEGPYILHAGEYYYLFLSYANLEAVGGYQMRIYRSENISGPYVDQNGVSAIRKEAEDVKMTNYGLRLFGSYDAYGIPKVQVAQGHNSAFVDDDGKIHLVYHTRFQSDDGKSEIHQVRVHQMFVNEDGWLVAAPYEYSGETIPPAGYAMEDMAGTYEFIYHEPTSYYKVVGDKQLGIVGRGKKGKTVEGKKEVAVGKHISTVSFEVSFSQTAADTVTLNEDGSVTGTYHGTWVHDKEKVTIDLGDGYVYKGVFLKQANEASCAMTMTFTAAGKNVSVWGIKPLANDEGKDDEEE